MKSVVTSCLVSATLFGTLLSSTAFAGKSTPWADIDSASPRAQRPWRSYVKNPDIKPLKPAPVAGGGRWILFLNGDGGVLHGTGGSTWEEDSSANKSSISDAGDHNVPGYEYGDASWAEVVQCMREEYARFNIEVTDVDPGSTPHVEVIFAPRFSSVSPSQARYDDFVGGIAPSACEPLNGVIAYTFTSLWGNSPRDICETAAQESAHAFGLDHEFLCEDPMTYLSGCGRKSFQDVDAPCGEDGARTCSCGGSTQNSVRVLYSVLGSRGDGGPPTVEISNPTDGATVQQNFLIDVQADDEIGIAKVDVFLDGGQLASDATPPYGFRAPGGLEEGDHDVTAVATNFSGQTDETTVRVNVAPPCSNENNNCADHYVCLQGACVPGPDFEGGLGAPCGDGITCAVGQCGSDGTDQLCVGGCTVDDSSTCPGGFDCLDAGGAGVCWPNGEDIDDGGASGGCAAAVGARHAPTFAGLAFLALFGLVAVRRRRRR